MAILIDQIVTYDSSNIGDNTVPLGFDTGTYGTSWCHLVSDTDAGELVTFLDSHPAIDCVSGNIRYPINGSNVTYCGLNTDQRDQALLAGASPQRRPTVFHRCFDWSVNGEPATYEP